MHLLAEMQQTICISSILVWFNPTSVVQIPDNSLTDDNRWEFVGPKTDPDTSIDDPPGWPCPRYGHSAILYKHVSNNTSNLLLYTAMMHTYIYRQLLVKQRWSYWGVSTGMQAF
jgi:hypothetical protein